MGDTRLVFLGIQTYLENLANDNGFSQCTMAASISNKIKDYWMVMDVDSTVSAILDPRSKLSVFSNELESSARAHIQSIFKLYKEREQSSSIVDSAPPTPIRNTNRQYFSMLRQNVILANENEETFTLESEVKTELDYYFEQPIDEEADPLFWWQAHLNEFPILSNMARDYLSIQATSVASEQAFSIAGNTVTKTRNRLLPETTRACLCAKSWLDKGLVNF